MNEQEWNEIWDEEPDEDNEFNDFGSDVDANNDETFDNAAEWNEDEHEELIARDSILSHNTRRAQSTSGNTGERILTVDELEKQLLRTSLNSNSNIREQTTPTINHHVELNKRAGWTPFGGKEIFNSPDTQTQSQLGMGSQNILAHGHLPNSLILEQQRQLHQQMALMKQQQIQAEQRLMAQNPQCFTLEEIERQILAERSIHNQGNIQAQPIPERPNLNDRGRDQQRYHHHRGNQRDHRHKSYRARGPIIVPPQVQLSVIEKGKNLHPLASTQGDDEYLQDRVPTMKDGFLMKRHSTVSKNKPSHDGVLTEKEKKWLIQMQEKILADYDVNYLSSYNRYLRIYFPNLGNKCEK